jgi:hypothetical protein
MQQKSGETRKGAYRAPEIATYSGKDVETALGPALAVYGGLP